MVDTRKKRQQGLFIKLVTTGKNITPEKQKEKTSNYETTET